MSNSRVVDRTPLLFTLLGAVGKVLLGAVLTFLLGAVGKILLDVVLFLLQLQHRIQAKSFGYRVNGVGAAMKLVADRNNHKHARNRSHRCNAALSIRDAT